MKAWIEESGRAPSTALLRLRGGVQGWYMDKMEKGQKRGRAVLRRGPEKEVFERMMNIKEFPEELEPIPLTWDHTVEELMNPDNLNQITQPKQNVNRIVYNAVGGEVAAYNGFGLAGMAVEQPRKWPYAIPETTGHRSWKSSNVQVNGTFTRRRPSAGAAKVSFKTSWRQKMELKEKRAALKGIVNKLQAKAVAAKEAERHRLQARRLVRLQNRRYAEQYQIVSNPTKLAKKTKKELRKMRRIGPDAAPLDALRIKR